MKISFKNDSRHARKFQQGGPMDAPEEAPVSQGEAPEEAPQEGTPEEQQGDPISQLAQIFMQGLQNQDCNALAQGAQMFLQLVQQQQGGGEPQPDSEPVFRKGGRLAYRIKK